MRRVLFVIHYPVFGGPYNQALRLSAPLAAEGFETVVVMPTEARIPIERLRAAGIPTRSIPLHRLRATRHLGDHMSLVASAPAEIRRLRALIRDEGIDIVQLGGLVNPHAAIAARLERIPVVWQLVDTRAPRPVAAAAMLLVDALADVVMSTGLAVARAHPRYDRIADRLVPFFPPVDTGLFAPRPGDRVPVRASWGVPADCLVVGSVANVNPQKGIVEMVAAFSDARSRAERSDVALVLVGEEYDTHRGYSALVRDRIRTAGLAEGRDVIFVGGRPDVERQLAGMDVFVLTAVPRSEGITTAVLEAMAAGVPPVVTDVGALREAITDGLTGLVVPPNDPAAFGHALGTLIIDEKLRRRMGHAARRAAHARFGLAASSEAHVDAYHRALRRERTRRAR
jgi:glycosyltransferase involved in cell wall biosynthesis